VARLLALKRRSPAKGLIVIAASFDQVEGLLQPLDSALMRPVLASWPGPHTWLFPARAGVPRWLTGDHPTLAVRVTAHPLARALCRNAGPLVSTSANPAGCRPARDALTVRRYFGERLDLVLGGPVGSDAAPSTIHDAATGRVLRGAA